MSAERVGVVGLGTMGRQIALVFARAGLETVVCDRTDALVAAAVEGMRGFLESRVRKGRLEREELEKTMARVHGTTLYENLASADLVVEAVFEEVSVKREVFARLDEVCAPETILATNTSTLAVTEIAAATSRADRCIGTHFLIPAALTPLVEVSRGLETSDETVEATRSILGRCGKDVVVVKDAPGFVINRLYIPLLNEAFFALEEGLATPEEIDEACVKGLGMPLGPLAASDASGLDVVLMCIESLHDQLGDKYRPAPLLRQLVRAGRLGRKTGRGVY